MNLRLPDHLGANYRSSSQRARIVTENWTATSAFCPLCQQGLAQAAANTPALDFYCPACALTFELKSKKGRFGHSIVDGAYSVIIKQITSNAHPNLLLLGYTTDGWVTDFSLVPKRFFVPALIEKRKPLSLTARRTGWVGCNLRIGAIPADGRIYYVRDGAVNEKEAVTSQWIKTAFLDQVDVDSRAWLVSVMACVQSLNQRTFALEQVYQLVPKLQEQYPNNRHIRAKIRQQLQVLRDKGWLTFRGRGVYSLNV